MANLGLLGFFAGAGEEFNRIADKREAFAGQMNLEAMRQQAELEKEARQNEAMKERIGVEYGYREELAKSEEERDIAKEKRRFEMEKQQRQDIFEESVDPERVKQLAAAKRQLALAGHVGGGSGGGGRSGGKSGGLLSSGGGIISTYGQVNKIKDDKTGETFLYQVIKGGKGYYNPRTGQSFKTLNDLISAGNAMAATAETGVVETNKQDLDKLRAGAEKQKAVSRITDLINDLADYGVKAIPPKGNETIDQLNAIEVNLNAHLSKLKTEERKKISTNWEKEKAGIRQGVKRAGKNLIDYGLGAVIPEKLKNRQ